MSPKGFGKNNSKRSRIAQCVEHLSPRKKVLLIVCSTLLVVLLGIGGLIYSSNLNPATARQGVNDNYDPAVDRTLDIFTAVSEMNAGTSFRSVQIKHTKIKEDSDAARKALANGVITDVGLLRNNYAKVNIPAGVPILKNQITGSPEHVVVVPAKNMYATVINLEEDMGIDEIVVPGSYVDVILTYTEDKQVQSKRVAESVKVLLVNTEGKERSRRRSSSVRVTLEVDSEVSLKMKTYQDVGKLSLVLRSPEDRHASSLKSFGQEELAGKVIEEEDNACEKGVMVVDGQEFCV